MTRYILDQHNTQQIQHNKQKCDTFDYWALLYLNTTHQASLFDFNLDEATNYAKKQGYTNLYFIWWNQNITSYNLQISNLWKTKQNMKDHENYKNNKDVKKLIKKSRSSCKILLFSFVNNNIVSVP